MAGAWGWYRAVCCAPLHHIGMHGTVIRRLVVQHWDRQIFGPLEDWAADPRTTPAMLRQALDDVVACEVLAPSETDTLKIEYLDDGPEARPAEKPGPRRAAWFSLRRFWSHPRLPI